MVMITVTADPLLCAPRASEHSKWVTCFYSRHDSASELHFTDEEVEAQRDEVPRSQSPSSSAADPGFVSGSLTPNSLLTAMLMAS